jgi:hypothetical protein
LHFKAVSLNATGRAGDGTGALALINAVEQTSEWDLLWLSESDYCTLVFDEESLVHWPPTARGGTAREPGPEPCV